MLMLTEAAAEVVKGLTSTQQAPDRAGLRIESPEGEPGNPRALQISAAPGPSENDQVVEAAGAHVYLEPRAAAYLADKVLDAQVDNDGKPHFLLGIQDPGQV